MTDGSEVTTRSSAVPWDRVETLCATFRAAATRMRDLPIYNPALDVEAVGFRTWEGNLCGVMVTPWFMSVVLIPSAPGPWSDRQPGDKILWRLPSGRYEFGGGGGGGQRAGLYLSCSLFSPMFEFADHETARAAAGAAAEALFQAEEADAERPCDRGLERRAFLSAVASPGGLR